MEQSLHPIRVGIVGLGKIALEEHIPALQANDAFTLAAAVGTNPAVEGLPLFASIEAMLDAVPDIDAVAVCTPPQAHYAPAKIALSRGKHVLLEKPPCPSLAEFEDLTALAAARKVTLLQSWHARETPVVAAAAAHLAKAKLISGRVVWKEDVRHWHPGQNWIWSEGGFGVLDAGINAISILTAILRDRLYVEAAHFLVPSNCASPIAAAVAFATESGAMIDAEFDFRHGGIQTRAVEFDTEDGVFNLGRFSEQFGPESWGETGCQCKEYASLYRRFAGLIRDGLSDTDKRPLELVLEIFRIAGRSTVAPFHG